MILNNLTKNTVVTKDLKVASSFIDRFLGLLNPKNSRSLIFRTRFGIHTFLLKEEIDVIVVDKNFVVKKIKALKPNRILFYNLSFENVIELPRESIRKSKTKINDKLKMLE